MKIILTVILAALGWLFCWTMFADAAAIHARTGATATGIQPRYAAQFQAFVDDLEAHGVTIKFMGGYRPGRCWQADKHACGMAIDVCQYARNVVDSRCHLSREVVAELAEKHGLFSGGLWCNPDFGHVEAGGSVACGHQWTGREWAGR